VRPVSRILVLLHWECLLLKNLQSLHCPKAPLCISTMPVMMRVPAHYLGRALVGPIAIISSVAVHCSMKLPLAPVVTDDCISAYHDLVTGFAVFFVTRGACALLRSIVSSSWILLGGIRPDASVQSLRLILPDRLSTRCVASSYCRMMFCLQSILAFALCDE
jgi:hypothetical protein